MERAEKKKNRKLLTMIKELGVNYRTGRFILHVDGKSSNVS